MGNLDVLSKMGNLDVQRTWMYKEPGCQREGGEPGCTKNLEVSEVGNLDVQPRCKQAGNLDVSEMGNLDVQRTWK
jgi:hypothetical protein